MNIIAKDKKDIRWVGFPVNALFECELIDVIWNCLHYRRIFSCAFIEKNDWS
jgi:hypothetical protein